MRGEAAGEKNKIENLMRSNIYCENRLSSIEIAIIYYIHSGN